MTRNWLLGISLVGVMVNGCTARVGDFTALSTRNVKLSGKRAPSRVKGESCDVFVFGFPVSKKDMKVAAERALESAGTQYDALVDVTVDTSWFSIGLYGNNCIQVAGTPVSTLE